MVLKCIGLTGASGMVGRHVLRLAGQRSIRCRTSSRTRPPGVKATDSWSRWDINEWRDKEELDAIFGDLDAIVHAGAVVAPNRSDGLRGMVDANVRACVCIGEWARDRGIPLVFLSGATVYADAAQPGITEGNPKVSGAATGGFYGLTKYLGELVLNYLSSNGLKLVTLRPASIYGPGLPVGKLVRDFLDRAGRGEALRLTQPADDRYNLVHASDVATAALDALEAGAFSVFNIAGETITLADLAKSCISVVGRGSVHVDDTPSGRPPRSLFDLDCAAAAAAFGYRPRVSIEEGLRTMLHEVLEGE